jgi:hypothetical protein
MFTDWTPGPSAHSPSGDRHDGAIAAARFVAGQNAAK